MEQISHIPGQPIFVSSSRSTFRYGRSMSIERERSRSATVRRDVAGNLLIALSGSFQTSPTFYLNPQNNVSYNVAVQTPQYDVKSLQELQNFPIAATGTSSATDSRQSCLDRSWRRTGNREPLQCATSYRYLWQPLKELTLRPLPARSTNRHG